MPPATPVLIMQSLAYAALHQDDFIAFDVSFDVAERAFCLFCLVFQLVCQLSLLGRHGGNDSYFHV